MLASIAQQIEQFRPKEKVAGAIPAGGTKIPLIAYRLTLFVTLIVYRLSVLSNND